MENCSLSAIRENILNWYPFEKGQSALEIDAEGVSVAEMLRTKLEKVVSIKISVELTKIDLEEELEGSFDYVIIHGLFAPAVIAQIEKYLKTNGKLLLAVDNKLGLKYFNGAKDAYTEKYFSGLNNYKEDKRSYTFSKQEWKENLGVYGFPFVTFYYPYPDYRFPSEIFTDESICSNGYGRPYINIETDRYQLFDEDIVGKSLMKEKVRDIFANSFLLEASREAFESKVIYVKLNSERKEEFQIGTSIVKEKEEKKVKKYAIHPDAVEHIQRIYDNANVCGKGVVYLPAEKEETAVTFEFLKEDNLDSVISNAIAKQEKESIHVIIDKFFDAYLQELEGKEIVVSYHNETFQKYFGDEELNKELLCVKNANIDVIMDNIYDIDGIYTLIDGEWIYPEWIPYVFIKWRAINELYSKHLTLSSLIPRDEMMEKNGIEVEDEAVYHSWAMHFAEVYVGSYKRRAYAKTITPISLDEIHREYRKQCVAIMSLYVDTGNGFSESEKLSQEIEIKDGCFAVTFMSDILKNAKKLRFDPTEGVGCVVNIKQLSEGVKVTGNNAWDNNEDGNVFADLDPQYYIDVQLSSTEIKISGTMQIMSKEELLRWLIANNEKLSREINTAPYCATNLKEFVKRKFKILFDKD